MHGITPSSDWTTLLAGFIVGGIGIGLVNPPLASTAVSVVPPQRAGMASGINNTFRQVGIATGIAALGAIFQDKIELGACRTGRPAQAVASDASSRAATIARAAFIAGLNEILLVAAIVAFVGAVLAFVLVRQRDFVASGPRRSGAAKRLRRRAERGLTRSAKRHAAMQQDHGGAGDDHERLGGDREGERVGRLHAARDQDRGAGAGLRRGSRRGDRQRRRGGRGAEEGEGEREGAVQRERVQEQEDRRAAQHPGDGDEQPGRDRLLRAVRVRGEPAPEAEARHPPPARDAWAGTRRRAAASDARGGDDDEAGAHRPRVARPPRRPSRAASARRCRASRARSG